MENQKIKTKDLLSLWKKFIYGFFRFWHRIIEIPRGIYYFCQRGSRGYADCDVWDLDEYLTSWMPQALRKLKGIGCPERFYDDSKSDAATLSEQIKDGGEFWMWWAALEKMAQGFEIPKLLEKCSDDYAQALVGKRSELDKQVLKEKFLVEWAELENKRKEYMQLFVDNYLSLWD